MTERFDMVVIGSGPAGEKAATQAAYFGRRVAIVERSPRPGGVVVSNAGIPTKTLRETALYVTGFRKREVYGVSLRLDPKATLERLMARTAEVTETMTRAVEENLRRHRIELVRGFGTLRPGRVVEVRAAGGGRRLLRGDVVLIATGSRPLHPPGIPFEDHDVLDSESILGIERIPRDMVVVGGGAVGCEYASIFTALGVRVMLLDLAPRVVPFMDGEISDLLAATFSDLGMSVRLGVGVERILRDPNGLCVVTAEGDALRPDKVLFAGGRAGNTEGLGLEAAGVRTDPRGRILVDERYRTTAEGVYAAGDVIGPPALASVSMEQGRVAACHAFGIPFKQTVDPLAPFGVYSIPEAAMAGLTEEQARERAEDYEVGRAPFGGNARAAISGSTEGMIKLVFRRADLRLLGVHILGEIAGELVHQGQAVLHEGGGIDRFIHGTMNVPTRSDAYKYAAYDGLQRLARRVVA